MEQMRNDSPIVEAMEGIINTIAGHDRPLLRKEAERLKQKGGETWAIGEMVERTCIMLDGLNIKHAGSAPDESL